MLRSCLHAAALAAIFAVGATTPVSAQETKAEKTKGWENPDGPDAKLAKEGPKASVSILHISADETFSAVVKGSVELSVAEKFGASFDAIAGVGDEKPIYGAAGRIFWRDPKVGMLGVYAVGTHAEFFGQKIDVFGVGGEGALYFGKLDLKLAAGFITGKGVPDDFVSVGSVGYYVLDDLRLGAGARYYGDELYGAFDFEYGLRGLRREFLRRRAAGQGG